MPKKTIKDNVEKVLARYPQSRNNDKLLILMYWKDIDGLSFGSEPEFIDGVINKSTSTESIRRARQLIQEDGRFLPTDETVLARRMKKSRMESAIQNRQVV